jgi:hypothetical protein
MVTGPGYPLVLEYIGYPYGGDAIVAQIGASYLFPGSASISARLFGLIHGRMHFLFPTTMKMTIPGNGDTVIEAAKQGRFYKKKRKKRGKGLAIIFMG